KVVSSEIGTKIRTVPKDRSVFHEPVSQKHFLATANIFRCKNHLAVRIKHPCRNRRRVGIGTVGKHPENEKTTQKNNQDRLHPSVRNKQRSLFGVIRQGFSPLVPYLMCML